MEDYLEGAIVHAIARGEHLLSLVPPNLSREFHALAQKCTDEISAVIDHLKWIIDKRERLGFPEKYRAYRRGIRDLESIELIGVSALERSNRTDRRISRLIDCIRLEIRHPLPVSPAVTSLSPGYFHIFSDFNLLRVPLSEENFLLHLPDLYHELAHPLLAEENHYPQVKPFQSALKKCYVSVLSYLDDELSKSELRGEPDEFRYPLLVWRKCWADGWLEELFCDLYAVCTVGPAYGWSHLHLCAKKSDSFYDVPTVVPRSHPADDARMRIILFALDHLGFQEDLEQLQGRWEALVRLRAESVDPDYGLCYPRTLLLAISDEAIESVKLMNVSLASPTVDGFIRRTLNQAWKDFWKAPTSYVGLERQAVRRLREHCMRSID
jgi:hypothetical protein